jgi:3-oxoacid CoA-transferase subunit A
MGMASKTVDGAREALAGVLFDGMTIMAGGFGLCGIPENLIAAIRDAGVKDLTVVSNNCGIDDFGLGLLLAGGQIRKMISSYVGENKLFAEQYLSGALEVEFVPQGTLAERLRAGGAGIPAFFTPTGVGTPIAEGKEEQTFDGVRAIKELGIVADVALVKAHRADSAGNLRYRLTARNFNPLVATAGKLTIVEAEEIIDGFIDPDDIHTPGIYVQRMVTVEDPTKDIEQRTVRSRVDA